MLNLSVQMYNIYFVILYNYSHLIYSLQWNLLILQINSVKQTENRIKHMKYTQLTKEQFEELHEEFALFLAAQSIDVKEWDSIKKDKRELADKHLNAFSDFVWEKVLDKANYLDHFSKDTLNLFKCNKADLQRIVVKVKKEGINLLNEKDFNWFIDNSKDGSIEYLKGKKGYNKEKNLEIFDLIQQGGVVSDGALFEAIHKIIG